MKDSRIGELLWSEWTGHGYEPVDHQSTFSFFTEGHIDISHEVVKRALASAIQRDGSVDSLGQAFKLIEDLEPSLLYAGYLDEDTEYTACDEQGMTLYEDIVKDIIPITVVDISVI
jgi:hypothetical protein